MTAQGHPRTAFRRAIERGNLVVAEIEAREVGQLDLGEALELTALVAPRGSGPWQPLRGPLACPLA